MGDFWGFILKYYINILLSGHILKVPITNPYLLQTLAAHFHQDLSLIGKSHHPIPVVACVFSLFYPLLKNSSLAAGN